MKRQLHARLWPLYVAAFFHGFVLWYTIEKLFMRDIGFTDATIGLMVAVYSAVMLVVETPSGILADRWSRKGVLVLASVALALSSLVGGMSNDISLYLCSTVLWGIFFALYSGMYDTLVYDIVMEETGNSRRFDFFYGRVNLADSVALVAGSLIGGTLANFIGLRQVYFLTIPLALGAIVALVKFKEPQLHKSDEVVTVKAHITQTFRAVTHNRQLLPILLVLVLLTALTYTLLEFSQLWLLALAAPILAFGPANATLLSSIGAGGLLASYFKIYRYPVMLVVLVLMIGASLGLVFFKGIVAVVAAQVVFGTILVGVTVVFKRLLHDALSSHVRAGASSAISTFSRICMIPLALVFGYISKASSVFKAAWLLLALAAVIVVLIVTIARRNERTGLYPY